MATLTVKEAQELAIKMLDDTVAHGTFNGVEEARKFRHQVDDIRRSFGPPIKTEPYDWNGL